MQIGELSKLTGFSRDTLRYYEKLGLLPPNQFQYAANENNNYRYYKASAVLRLQQIQSLKNIGFSLEEIHHLLHDLNVDDPCRDLPSLFNQKISLIDEKINQLLRFKSGLENSLKVCSSGCTPIASTHENKNTMPSCLDSSVQFYSPEISTNQRD